MTDNSPATDEEIAEWEAALRGERSKSGVVINVNALIARIHAETAKNSGEDEIIAALLANEPFVFDPATHFVHADDGGAPEHGIKYAPAEQIIHQEDREKLLDLAQAVNDLVHDSLAAELADLVKVTLANGKLYATPANSCAAPVVAVKPMCLSDNRVDYYVSIQVGTKEVTPHVFGEEYKAAYHVALYDWLLNGGNEPDILAFDEDDFPAQKTVANSRAETILECLRVLNEDSSRSWDECYAALEALLDTPSNSRVEVITDDMVERGFKAVSMGRYMEPTDAAMIRSILKGALLQQEGE